MPSKTLIDSIQKIMKHVQQKIEGLGPIFIMASQPTPPTNVPPPEISA